MLNFRLVSLLCYGFLNVFLSPLNVYHYQSATDKITPCFAVTYRSHGLSLASHFVCASRFIFPPSWVGCFCCARRSAGVFSFVPFASGVSRVLISALRVALPAFFDTFRIFLHAASNTHTHTCNIRIGV